MKTRLLIGTAAAVLLLASCVQVAAAQTPRRFTERSPAEIAERRSGQPYVLAFWSLDCPPCREELAELGRRPTRNLVLVSTDALAPPELILATLAQYGLARAEAWVFDDALPPQRLRAAVDRTWLGELPRSYFCAPDGACLATSGRPAPALLDRWLGPAVTEGADRR